MRPATARPQVSWIMMQAQSDGIERAGKGGVRMGVKKDERSEQPVDSLFFVPRVAVAIVDTGSPGEALLLRAVLESMGAIVTLHQPGTPEDFLIVLGQGERAPPFLVICGHGDDKGFIFGEFMPPIDTAPCLASTCPPAQWRRASCCRGGRS